MEYTKYELINYFDVWGNPEEGYEVNNMCSEGMVSIPDGIDNKEQVLLDLLIEKDLIKTGVTLDQLSFSYDGSFIEVYEAAKDMPLFSFRPTY